MRDPLLGWHPVAVVMPATAHTLWGYAVMKQTRGKRQRYSLYATTAGGGLTYTRLTRDLTRENAERLLRVLVAVANSTSNG
jgi:hypothetical protein